MKNVTQKTINKMVELELNMEATMEASENDPCSTLLEKVSIKAEQKSESYQWKVKSALYAMSEWKVQPDEYGDDTFSGFDSEALEAVLEDNGLTIPNEYAYLLGNGWA